MGTPKCFSVLSWNCLADCYAQGAFANRSNHSKALRWSYRSNRIFEILRQQNADIVCLQEVDHFEDEYKPFLSAMDYNVVYVQRNGREDGILIAVKRCKFVILEEDVVQFDDLARFEGLGFSEAQRNRFRKQNVALILLLRLRGQNIDEETGHEHSFTVCTTHMYWNPSLPQVKLAQARYLLERLTYVRRQDGLTPDASVLTGDFNSLPTSKTYMCILEGIPFPNESGRCAAGAVRRAFAAFPSGPKVVRFLCDGTLTRLARWLRLLGVDTALEDKMSQERRTQWNDFSTLFERARSEQRVLVTTSTSLVKRASCPETFLVRTAGDLERSLAALLNRYDVELDRANFLSVCAKCGGRIEACSSKDLRLQGKDAPKDRELFICSQCLQVYWWSSSENGSSARARRLAENLFVKVERSRIARTVRTKNTCTSEIRNELLRDCGCPLRSVSDDQKQEGFDRTLGGNERVRHEKNRQVMRKNWLRYSSAMLDAIGKEPPYTNVNGDFCGTLDYIFVGGSCAVSRASVLERTSLTPNSKEKSFPNLDWPSDHMMVTALVSLEMAPLGRGGFARTLSSLS